MKLIYALTFLLSLYQAKAQCLTNGVPVQVESNLQDFVRTRVNAFRVLYNVTTTYVLGYQDISDAALGKSMNVPMTAISGCTDHLWLHWADLNSGTPTTCCDVATDCPSMWITNTAGTTLGGFTGYVAVASWGTPTPITAANIEQATDLLFVRPNTIDLLIPALSNMASGVGISSAPGTDGNYYLTVLQADAGAVTGTPTLCTAASSPIVSSAPVMTTTTTSTTGTGSTTMTSTSSSGASATFVAAVSISSVVLALRQLL